MIHGITGHPLEPPWDRVPSVAFGLLAVAAGVYCALAAWFPSLRARWKGTQIVVGPLASVGFALASLSMGVVFVGGGVLPGEVRLALLVVLLAGFGSVAIGCFIDHR